MIRAVLAVIGFCAVVAAFGVFLVMQPYLNYREFLTSTEEMDDSGGRMLAGLKIYRVEENDPYFAFYQELQPHRFEHFSVGLPAGYRRASSTAGIGVRIFRHDSGNRIAVMLDGITTLEDRLGVLGLSTEYILEDVRNDILKHVELKDALFSIVVFKGLEPNPAEGVVAVRIETWKGLRFDRAWVVYELWKGNTYKGTVAFSKMGQRLKEEEEAMIIASLRLSGDG